MVLCTHAILEILEFYIFSIVFQGTKYLLVSFEAFGWNKKYIDMLLYHYLSSKEKKDTRRSVWTTYTLMVNAKKKDEQFNNIYPDVIYSGIAKGKINDK